MYFDTHTHYDDKRFRTILPEIMERAEKLEIQYMINAARGVSSNFDMKELGMHYPQMRRAVGRHPRDIGSDASNDREIIKTLKAMLQDPDVCAVGETGLDLHHPGDMERQIWWFREQIDWALEYELPLILHIRDALKEALPILDEHSEKSYRGVLHCFTGDAEMAKEYIARGFLIGLGGKVTNPQEEILRDAVRHIPLESMVLETDCPYLVPYGHKGPNHSLFLPLICETIAEIKGCSAKQVEEHTYRNAMTLFRL